MRAVPRIAFEPWGLGDAVIAAAALRERATSGAEWRDLSLATRSQWHPLLRAAAAAYGEELPFRLLATDLPYTTRDRTGPFDTGQARPVITRPANPSEAPIVLSIRGDARDWIAARKLFPGARTYTSGWFAFLARRIAPLGLPSALGWTPVRNRYEAWADLLGMRIGNLDAAYADLRERRAQSATPNRLAIHVGAQWRSRQYPHVARLAQEARARGLEPRIIAGPSDPLPTDVGESEVLRPGVTELITELRSAQWVVTNDSGPMHLAAFSGCSVTALARVTDIEEWRPPGVQVIQSPAMPRGYRPSPDYCSDRVLEEWPEPEEVLKRIIEGTPK